MLSKLPLITASDRLYFAYGSNLSPEQMAHRCPDSIFLGKATLPEHRWQVNERGVANVVRVPRRSAQEDREGRRRGRDGNGDDDDAAVVEGLIYAISAEDERQLDLYEGVAKGRYERQNLWVDFEPVRGNVFARCTSASVAKAVREEREEEGGIKREERRARSWGEGEGDQQRRRRDSRHHQDRSRRRAASVGHPPTSSSSAAVGSGGWRSSILGLLGIPGRTRRAPSPSPARDRERAVGVKPVWALVYASTVHVRDGDIRARYVPRMERAMADAAALGVSRSFIEKQMLPQVRPAWRASRRMSLAGGEDGPEKEREKGRRDGESGRRRSVYQ
ncbi:hypothetical protein INS49_015272 [Diaporthe citri]|uniref:uncharacterized protein n=1 Tax=Diaporthe citri TaxID=83186 RepID=UPI001C8200B1|nr:uncharacterized protein INS49_015272 [Diaporthe citri]KAG6355888.1 hypothetical protein INS49_015272 [Diaporthe citri]